MTTKTKLSNRLLSIVLCIALLLGILPAMLPTASAAAADGTRTSDPSTMDGWKDFFLPTDGSLNTENAGGVWTDKSVFTDASAFAGTGITMDRTDGFLVALSTIASNMSITGMSHVPTDTILVLDVSGSMNDNENNNDVAEELVEAANTSVHTLLTANTFNRVGIVLYSSSSNGGSASVVLLPLGRYTTGDDHQYISYTVTGNRNTTETVSLDANTVIEGTTTRPSSTSKEVVGGTFIQNGLHLAKEQFVATTNETTVTDPTLGTLKRKPVLVLMSDGAPTYGSSSFTSPTSSNMGTGSRSTAGLGFVTQLTAAYIKNRIEEKYSTDCLFYTLGLGTGNDTVATSVLDPDNSSSAVNSFWTQYDAAAVGGTVQVQNRDRENNLSAQYVTKIEEALSKSYVDRYFDSSDYTGTSGSGSLAEALKNAFAAIVDDIQLQSKYYPTLISDSEELSGYISFVDRIGQYMDVTDVKGILINNILYSGADLAQNFASGSNGGALGTVTNPTALGDEMVWAVQARLGIATADEARTLIGLAYQYGQLSYTSSTEFSNYIGWYANAQGQFLGFWHEGITTMPDPSDPTLTDETRPAYIIKSYGYLGAVDEEHGVSASDMMYATVQLREDILTGEQTVAFAIPAALIPIVTYNVTLDGAGNLSDLTATGATEPIRLVYEVALDDAINEFTLTDLVSSEYLAQHTAADGSVSFYTNQYEVDNSTGYDKVNTYSYFNPSRQNDKYYYLEDAPVFTDTSGTLYTGTAQPSGVMYRRYKVYTKNGNTLDTVTVYRRLSDAALATTRQTEGSNTWYIPQGNVHVNLDGYLVSKTQNTTGTLPYANVPFVDASNHSVDDLGYNFIIGATLGNNGKLSVTPTTGIRITKEMAADATAPDAPFTFTLTNVTNPQDNAAYPAYRIPVSGEPIEFTVSFTAGTATVELAPGEILYIGGMTAGQTILIEEAENMDYIVESVNADSDAKSIRILLQANTLSNADFVNADRGRGNLTIGKEVTHDFGEDYNIPADKSFTITVTLAGIGTANATFPAQQTGSDITSVTTDENGQFTVTLKSDQQITLSDLPAGTVATVTEQNPGDGFTAQYWDNGQLGDGIVTVIADNTVSVIVVNDYTAARVYPVNISISGTKVLTGRDWDADDSFTFLLQRQTGENTWVTLDTQTVLGTDTSKSFDFNGTLSEEEYTAAGTYYYRVIEIEPEGDLQGITYDKTVHSFAVDVADADMDGKLEIAAVRASRPDTTLVTQPTSNSWHVAVTFTNIYRATGSATVTIDLNKKVTNLSGSHLAHLSGFTFELVDENGVVQFTSQPTTDRGFARLVMTYEAAGTYHYILREVTPDPIPDGWTYSDIQIPVTVIVIDTGDGHFTARIYQGTTEPEDAGTSISTDFTNTYAPDPAELPIDFAQKHLSGRALVAGEFTFEVQDLEGNTLLTGTNDATGKVTFSDTLHFDTVGTYFFNIVETGTDGKGITHDKSTYRIAVTVTDVGGKLQASYVLVNIAGDGIVFRNTYTAASVGHSISGTKVLTGRVLLNDEFTFVLTEAMDANGTIAEGAAVYNAKNFTDGSFHFPQILYTAAGTYYYVVTETESGGADFGIRYDKTVYIVTVVITDDGEGQLVVSSVSYAIKGGASVEAIGFTNHYVPDPTYAQVSGDKELQGRVLAEGEFRFQLYSSNEAWEIGQLLQEVSNDATGTFTFTQMEYKAAGTYYYLVKELHGGQTLNGVTYDSTVYRVEIRVTDDLRGQLSSEILIFDDANIPQETLLFLNRYTAAGTDRVTLSGTKTLTGRALLPGEFAFLLQAADSTFTAIEDAPILRAVNNADGSFVFEDLTFEEVGTYYFIITEDASVAAEYILFDDTVYQVTIVVTDNGSGKLIASQPVITVAGSGEAVTGIVFENAYIVPPPKTGESTNISLLAALLFVSGSGLAATSILGRKKKEDA